MMNGPLQQAFKPGDALERGADVTERLDGAGQRHPLDGRRRALASSQPLEARGREYGLGPILATCFVADGDVFTKTNEIHYEIERHRTSLDGVNEVAVTETSYQAGWPRSLRGHRCDLSRLVGKGARQAFRSMAGGGAGRA